MRIRRQEVRLKAYGRVEKTKAEKEAEKQRELDYQVELEHRKKLALQVTEGMEAGEQLRKDM